MGSGAQVSGPRASGRWLGVLRGPRATRSHKAADFACVPFIETPGGSLQPPFEAQPGQRRQPAGPGDRVIQRTRRADGLAAAPTGQDSGTPDAPTTGPWGGLDQALAAIARQTEATLRIYPRPGRAVRHIVLRNDRDGRGTRYEDAALEHDGTLRITGHDQEPRVSEFWGDAITSYEWVYLVACDRIPALIRLLGGHDGDDAIALLPRLPPARGRADQRHPQPPRRDSTLQQLAQLTGQSSRIKA